ncbi:tRNA (guanosine(37)-N1)-methyltransferase TrmD [candidate division WWE3 bacterium RIFOXYC1_FULL_39_7]|uniref:tRNA (guanine-N(1)-)-methyltransferase n=1 Tax=candidate division WWE3 bacterium RIFOXYC1_FULL_39_7 TaxID=1802643 RepID=A0A1F4WN75_UNCKA|nr:MAG: tRNA (guanosine(37)-N1)-methyltransferase TrmD [candidate division WWE3 bacterium RIFOXYC1_FULL_39_7]
MKIDIVTLFPSMFEGPFATSMLKKAQDNNLVEINIHDLRKWSQDSHHSVDDRPYGGGKGMILMIEPIDLALKDLKTEKSHVILLSPQGKPFTQSVAQKLSKLNHLILIAGHYEGFDERIRENLIDEEVSIGDYVLTGGEIPAMVIVDAVTRLLPGVLDPEATAKESFSGPTLDFPQYTRPENYNDWKVPEILLTGHHANIQSWRQKEALKKTKRVRPDLLKK